MGLRHLQCSRSDGRCRVSPKWLQNVRERHLGRIDRPVFVLRLEKKIPVRDGQHLRHIVEQRAADECLLQKALIVRQTDEGFGMLFA